MKPYTVRFVSLESNKGKTSVATSVVSRLKLRGYLVAAIKHVKHEIDIDGKDTGRYISAGADIVVASSSRVGAVYYSRWVDSLDSILNYIDTPIVIVESFKKSGVGDVVAVVDTIDELEALSKSVVGDIVALVCANPPTERVAGPRVFSRDDVDDLTSFIESRALKFLESQLPQTNCSLCGYETCAAFAKAYAMGKTYRCPILSNIRLIVNDREVPLNPFVQSILRSTVEGFITALKGIPPQRRRVVIEIEF